MLYTYSITDQTVDTDGLLTFTNNGVLTGSTVSHTAGTSTISLNRAGYYEVHFNANMAATTGTADIVTIQLIAGGTNVDGAVASASNASARNLGFTAIVRVLPNCCAIQDNIPLDLTFENLGVGATFTDAAVTITKLC